MKFSQISISLILVSFFTIKVIMASQLLVQSLKQTKQKSVIYRNNKQKVSILGLFTLTNCTTGHEFECQNALFNEKSIIKVHQKQKFWFAVNVCTRDVRNSSKAVTDILLPMVSQDKGSVSMKCRSGDIILQRDATHTIIFTYASFHLTRLISSIILPLTNFLLVSVTAQPMYPAYYIEHPNAVYSYESGFGNAIHKEFNKVKNRLNISYALILNLWENDSSLISNKKHCAESQTDESAMCTYIKLNPTDCYKELNVNIEKPHSIERALNYSKKFNLSIVMLNGNSQSITRFLSIADINEEMMGETFFLPFIKSLKYIPKLELADSSIRYRLGTALSNFQGSLAMNSLFYYTLDIPNVMMKELARKDPVKTFWSRILNDKTFQTLLKQAINCNRYKRFINCKKDLSLSTVIRLYRISKRIIILIIKSFMEKREVRNFLIDFWKKTYYIENVSEQKLLNQLTFNPTGALKARPFCEEKKPQCKAGEELVHSYYKEQYWASSYGWNCKQCQGKFFKASTGNDQRCKQCLYPNTVNANHTTCYDPFTKITFQLYQPLSIAIIITPSILMAILTILTMVVFLVKRNSPIVLSANRRMTAIQLFTHLLLFTESMLLFLDTTPELCVGRQVFLGIAFSITISINISKSQKIYMIVGKQVLMNKSEILLTNASEWLIIFIALVVNAMLQSLSFINNTVTVQTKYHEDLLFKESYCSNDTMISAQLFMAAVLSICNGIQGFRARGLPSQFRETNHVIYSSFISFVVFIAATTTYFASKKLVDRSFIILLTTLIFNGTHFVLLYGYKVVVILLRPHKNTKEASLTKRLQKLDLSS